MEGGLPAAELGKAIETKFNARIITHDQAYAMLLSCWPPFAKRLREDMHSVGRFLWPVDKATTAGFGADKLGRSRAPT